MTRRFGVPPPEAAPPSRWPLTPIVCALGTAIALLPMPMDTACADETVSLPRTGLYRVVPERVRFPDGYAVDLHRDPPRFALGVDTDTIAEVQMWTAPASGWSMLLNVKDETPRLGSGGTQMQLRFELRF